MKAGWEVKTLGEVCTIINGGTPKSEVAAYWDGDVDWLTPKDMGKLDGHLVHVTPRRISREGLAKCSARQVPANSVIMSTRAPIGHLAINTVPMAFNQGCRGMVPSEKLDAKYLFYVLSANVQALDDLGTGTTFKELSAGSLKAFPIPLPPLDEQKRIVEVVDAAFEGLSRARAHTETNLQNARELFETNVARLFSASDDEWREAKLEDICEKITDGTHQTPTYFDSGYVFLSSKNVQDGQLDWEDVKYIDEAQHIQMQSRLAPRRNDILLRKNGAGYGKAAIVDRDVIFDVYVSLAVLRPLSLVLPQYLLHFVNSPVCMKQFESRIKGQGVPNLHLQEIREVKVAFPTSLGAQKEIVDQLGALMEQTTLLQSHYRAKLADLDALRQALLQKAFAGELT